MSNDDMSIIPEVDNHRRSSGKRPTKAPQASSSHGIKWILMCLLTVVLTGVSAYLYLGTERLKQDRDLLAFRVQQIEGQLSVTDESMSQSGAAIQVALKKQMSEIRKLWVVAYDNNKPEISKTKNEVKKIKSTLDNAAPVIAANKKNIAALLDSFDPAIKSYEGLQSGLDKAASQIENVSTQLLLHSTYIESQNSIARDLADQARSLKSAMNLQLNQINEHSEAIKSIDLYRLQLNQRLISLEQQFTRN